MKRSLLLWLFLCSALILMSCRIADLAAGNAPYPTTVAQTTRVSKTATSAKPTSTAKAAATSTVPSSPSPTRPGTPPSPTRSPQPGAPSSVPTRSPQPTAQPTQPPEASPTSGPEEPSPTSAPVVNGQVGQPLTVGTVKLTVVSFETKNDIGGETPAEGDVFVVVHITVQNTGGQALYLDPFYFALMDAEENSYDNLDLGGISDLMREGDVAPGGTLNASLVFETLAETKQLRFVFFDDNFEPRAFIPINLP